MASPPASDAVARLLRVLRVSSPTALGVCVDALGSTASHVSSPTAELSRVLRVFKARGDDPKLVESLFMQLVESVSCDPHGEAVEQQALDSQCSSVQSTRPAQIISGQRHAAPRAGCNWRRHR